MTASSTLNFPAAAAPTAAAADLFLRESARGASAAGRRFVPPPAGGSLPAAELPAAVIGYAGLHADAETDAAGLTGKLPSWHDLHEHLTAAGFSESDIAASGLSRAVTAAAGPLAEVDCLHVPALPGCEGLLAFREHGDAASAWKTVTCAAVGTATVRDAVLVGSAEEAVRLRVAGLAQTYFVPNLAAVGRGFWERLSTAGVERAVLLSCAANGEWADHLDAASAARDADSTPAVRLHELPESCGRSAADEVTRDGAAAFASRLFADVSPTPSSPQPVAPRVVEGFDAHSFWADVRPLLNDITEPMQRRAHERLAAEVCGLLEAGRPTDAEAALEGRRGPVSHLPTSTSHHVENVRGSSAGPALARRLFDLLRTTGAEVAVASPVDREDLLDRVAAEAVGHGVGPAAARSRSQLREELSAYGHRVRVVTTPRPQELDAAQTRLFAGADVILLDLTTQQTAFWWQQNGWCGRLTELAESADADLVAFWPAATPRRSAPALRSEVVGRLRAWTRGV